MDSEGQCGKPRSMCELVLDSAWYPFKLTVHGEIPKLVEAGGVYQTVKFAPKVSVAATDHGKRGANDPVRSWTLLRPRPDSKPNARRWTPSTGRPPAEGTSQYTGALRVRWSRSESFCWRPAAMRHDGPGHQRRRHQNEGEAAQSEHERVDA